ncbi:MAG: restriction endonuclease subunit S [Candidatus Cloacimonetes bacterium]|nr:restriction endonuclease subunit S [Candidatus Cloacimonadota bacterium]
MSLRNIQIKELCDIRMGHTFRQKPTYSDNGNVLVIQPGDLSPEGTLTVENLCKADVSAGPNVKTGDVLLINRGRFTATAFDRSPDLPCVASSAFIILTPKEPEKLLPGYIALFFNSVAGQNAFARLTETTTIPFLSCSNLGAMKISAPAPEKQRALVKLGEMNKAYIRLTSRKAELQNHIINRQIAEINH